MIPSAFGARPPNIADDKQATTADSSSFWLLHLGPVLLDEKFENAVYYHHFLAFSSIVEMCMQFEYTREDMDAIHEACREWVGEFERYVLLTSSYFEILMV